jgi:nucleoside-triphosphatase THEP1
VSRNEKSGPKPSQVFTPTQLPLERHNAYVHRAEAEEKVERFLNRGQVPVVFGEYGVGKTTVVRKVLRDLGHEKNLIYVPSVAGRTMNDILRVVLERLGYKVDVEEVSTDSRTNTVGAKLVVEGSLGETYGTTRLQKYAVQGPTDEKIGQLLRAAEVTLVVDELHRGSHEFRVDLADFIKTTHGQDSIWPQIVLIGTSVDSASLVANDPGIDRFVKELRVSPMTMPESRALVDAGFSTLGIQVGLGIRDLVTRTAAGAPSLLQSVCLDMAERALKSGRAALDEEDYRVAVKLYLEENGSRLAEAYTASIEHTGPKKYRKQILVAMSLIDDDFFELETIRKRIEERTGFSVEQTALSGPLRHLKEGSDSILQDVKRRDGDRVYNVSAFRDPMMKSFIRFMNELEDQGIVKD